MPYHTKCGVIMAGSNVVFIVVFMNIFMLINKCVVGYVCEIVFANKSFF